MSDNNARNFLNRYWEKTLKRNDAPPDTYSVAVAQTEQRSIEQRIAQAVPFLGLTNSLGVNNQEGQTARLTLFNPAAKRTNVELHEREADTRYAVTDETYACALTEYDLTITWDLLDAWGRDGDFDAFSARLDRLLIERQAKDRLLVGWHGTSAATETDPDSNPARADVNVGWLQQIRANASDQVISDEKTIGSGGDFDTLDALVKHAIGAKLSQVLQGDPDLRVIIGADMAPDGGADITQGGLIAQAITRRIAGRSALIAPFFPAGKVLVTSAANLSVYWQLGQRRQVWQPEPRRNIDMFFASSNDAYVIEDYTAAVLVDDVTHA